MKSGFRNFLTPPEIPAPTENNHPARNVDVAVPATKKLWVDVNRTDTYTPDGTIRLPFKTIGAALAVIDAAGFQICLAPGTYTEDIELDEQCCIEGSGLGTYIEGNVVVSTTNGNCGLGCLTIQGSGKTLTVSGTGILGRDIQVNVPMVTSDAAGVDMLGCSIVSAVSPSVNHGSSGTFVFRNGFIGGSHNDITVRVDSTGGFVLNNGAIVGSHATNPMLQGLEGNIYLIQGNIINSGGGSAIDVSAATPASPSAMGSIIAAGDIVCGAHSMMLFGVMNLSGTLTGSALLYDTVAITNSTLTGSGTAANPLAVAEYNPAPADGTYSGETTTELVGENVAFGDLLYFDWTDKEYKKAAKGAAATMPVVAIALQTKGNGEACKLLRRGFIRKDAWAFDASIVMAGAAGAPTTTLPDTAGDQVQRIGTAISAKIMYFNPDSTVVEVPA